MNIQYIYIKSSKQKLQDSRIDPPSCYIKLYIVIVFVYLVVYLFNQHGQASKDLCKLIKLKKEIYEEIDMADFSCSELCVFT